MKMNVLKDYVENQIFRHDYVLKEKFDKNTFHLDYTNKVYRESDFVSLLRDSIPYFALTEQEFDELETFEIQRTAWARISKARKDKKGDYGELLLFLILLIYYDAPKFVTKVRLRSSAGMQINGYDCAHFTIENEEPVLWLGESKFHQSFSTGFSDALKSLENHCKLVYTSDEISILKSNIEVNRGKEEDFLKLKNLFRGKSLDKIKFKIPVLLTYDSSIVRNNECVNEKFGKELKIEIEKLYKSIEKKDIISELTQIEFIFFLFPFHTVANIKNDLEAIEKVMKA